MAVPRSQGHRLLPVVALLVAGLVTGCDGDAPQAAGTPSRSAVASSSPAPSPSAAPTTTSRDTADSCVVRQKRAMSRGTWPIIQAVEDVLTSLTGESFGAVLRLRDRVERQVGGVREVCGQLPSRMRGWVRAVRRLPDEPMSDDELAEVLRSYRTWTSSLGRAAWAQDHLDELADCRAFQRRVRASHRVWWAWTDTGKVWWIELTIDNDSVERWGSTSGSGEASGPRRAGGTSGHEHLHWGASSADFLEIPPGTSQTLVAPLAGTHVHTSRSGTVAVRSFDIWVSRGPSTQEGCPLPVPAGS